MKERRYIRLKVDMHEDTKFKIIDKKTERDVIHYIWIRLISLAGKVNLDGDLYLSKNIPYTIKTLAIEFNRSEEQIKLALDTFMELEMVVLKENGVYRVINFAKHQNIKTKAANDSNNSNNNNNNNNNNNASNNNSTGNNISSATDNTAAKVNSNSETKSNDNNDANLKICNLKDVSNIKTQSEIIDIDCNDSSSNNNSSIDKKADNNPTISQLDVGGNISCNDNNAPIPLDIKKKKKKEDYCEIISLDEDSSITSSSDGFFEGEVPLDKDSKIIMELTF